jgi:hypothetical protein
MLPQDARFGGLIVRQCGELAIAGQDIRDGPQRHSREIQRRVAPATAAPIDEREVVERTRTDQNIGRLRVAVQKALGTRRL